MSGSTDFTLWGLAEEGLATYKFALLPPQHKRACLTPVMLCSNNSGEEAFVTTIFDEDGTNELDQERGRQSASERLGAARVSPSRQVVSSTASWPGKKGVREERRSNDSVMAAVID